MKLGEFFIQGKILRDKTFLRIGSVNSKFVGTLAYADNVRSLKIALNNTNIEILITTNALSQLVPDSIGLVLADSPRSTFYSIYRQYIAISECTEIQAPQLGVNVRIDRSAIVSKGCRFGDNVRVSEGVIIRGNVWIGSNVIIEPGVKIGVDGILYDRCNVTPRIIPHSGNVKIGDNTALMTNSVVVAAVFDTECTRIEESVIVGLGSIIGHEAKVGSRSVISNNCVVARGAIIGEDVFVGTMSMIKENLHIGDRAKIMAGSIVVSNVATDTSVSGNFATDHTMRLLAHSRVSSKI